MKPTKLHYPLGFSAPTLFPPPSTPHRHLNRKTKNIDFRYTFIKVLGLGREGIASIYHDSLRAHLQQLGAGNGKWPAEIPATLYFANSNALGEFEVRREERREIRRFIYAMDYFWVDGWMAGWEELLKHCGMSPSELDMVYRRRFRGVLMALREMHRAGYTHDDVKMDNIFISATNSFLLGDLGNVREHEHVYHAREDIHTEAIDYSQGDTQCAVRSYLSFLRLACGERRCFDSEFHARQEEWSRFYWRYKKMGATACEMLLRIRFGQKDKV
ncbi:hypothetical protein BDD12DRAFT_879498 [Trichophaea hybrida]|nr:hypothetical protein BDD12DRAFT_879498 [Trichophaea hybrida]